MFEGCEAMGRSEKAERAVEGGRLSPHLVIGKISEANRVADGDIAMNQSWIDRKVSRE
jgi:hypothetical protein